jgi:uncharacterized protein (DUF433 family)
MKLKILLIKRIAIKMNKLSRITFNPAVMGGKPCIRGMRVTVGMIVGLVASGHNANKILKLYPYLQKKDIEEALLYAAWRVEEIEMPLATA